MKSPGFPRGSMVTNLPAMQEIQVQSLGREDPLEKEMATHSIILAQEIPWMEQRRARVHRLKDGMETRYSGEEGVP